jgi:hypothetical protein
MGYGLNHIPLEPLCFDTALAELLTVTYTAAAACQIVLSDGAKQNIREQAIVWLSMEQAHLSTKASQQQQYPAQSLWDAPAVQIELKSLQSQVLIAEHDKAASQPVFLCKDYARYICLQRLRSDSFTLVQHDPEQLLLHITQQLASILPGITGTTGTQSLPYLRLSYKAHKQPPENYRFITNASDCALTPATKIAQAIASHTLQTLQDLCGVRNKVFQQLHQIHTQHYPIIKDYTECTLNLPDKIHTDRTADITKCFEAIPLAADTEDGLLHVLSSTLRVAVRHRQNDRQRPIYIFFKISAAKQKYEAQITDRKPHSGRWNKITVDQALALYELVVQNAMVQQGQHIYRQVVGIPMGFACSPDMMNIYALHYEMMAIQRIMKYDQGEVKLAKLAAFAHLYRLMDDVRIINGAAIHDLIFQPTRQGDAEATCWIYPACLQIKETTCEQGQVVFLDILTRHHADGSYSMQTFRKESKLPFTPVKFCRLASNRPSKACYNVLIGLIRSAMYHCSSPAKAAQDIFALIKAFQGNGFKRTALHKLVLNTLKQNTYPGLRYEASAVSRLFLARK